jgi:hypothetical protein
LTNFIKNYMLDKYLDLKLKMLKDENLLCSFPEDIKKIKRVYIIPDMDEIDDHNLQNFQNSLRKLFPNVRITLFQKKKLTVSNQNTIGAPNKAYLGRIKEDAYDLLIDLNLVQNKICSFIAANSGAPIRLNLASGDYDHVYNLHFRTGESKSTEERYNNILNYLKSLKPSK